jgi:hypothetical protein
MNVICVAHTRTVEAYGISSVTVILNLYVAAKRLLDS